MTVVSTREQDEVKNASCIDTSTFDDLRSLQPGSGNDLVRRVIDAFLGSVPSQIDTIREAVDKDDAESLRSVTHSLKSSTANVGAVHLSQLCVDLEQIGREGTTKGGDELLRLICVEYERVQSALRAMRNA